MKGSNKKRCGGCINWTKWKAGDGLCELDDLRCPSDYSCQKFKRPAYNRNKEKNKEI